VNIVIFLPIYICVCVCVTGRLKAILRYDQCALSAVQFTEALPDMPRVVADRDSD
jgi:hypothetical protein